MKNSFGNNISVTIFGESHGEYVGCVVDGLAPGIKIDYGYIDKKSFQKKFILQLYRKMTLLSILRYNFIILFSLRHRRIVRSFLGNVYIMRMRLTETCAGYANEFAVLTECLNIGSTAITHT